MKGFLIKIALVFILVSLYDFLKTRYVFYAANKDAARASIYSSIASLISSVVILSFINDYKMIIPATLGAFLGTWLSIRFNKNN